MVHPKPTWTWLHPRRVASYPYQALSPTGSSRRTATPVPPLPWSSSTASQTSSAARRGHRGPRRWRASSLCFEWTFYSGPEIWKTWISLPCFQQRPPWTPDEKSAGYCQFFQHTLFNKIHMGRFTCYHAGMLVTILSSHSSRFHPGLYCINLIIWRRCAASRSRMASVERC